MDFVVSVLFLTATETGTPARSLLMEVLRIYNEEFCDQIEQDASIRIQFVEV